MSASTQALPTPLAARTRWLLLGLALLAALPALLALISLAAAWNTPQAQTWAHLREHVLVGASGRTLVLVLGTGAVAAVLGVGSAALVSLCEFRGRRVIEALLVLPLAMPGYVLAYVWVATVDVGSPLRALVINAFGSATALPGLRNLPGAIVLLALTTYPYVYLLVRAALLAQGSALFEVARSQGLSPARAIVAAVAPALRPAIAAGVGLVMLETLAEFGAVSVLGIDTLSVVIYRTWYGMHALPAATQLASLLLLLALAVLALERALRGPLLHLQVARRAHRVVRLRGAQELLAIGAPVLLLLAAFGIPAIRLLAWSLGDSSSWLRLLQPATATAAVAAVAALCIAAAGLCSAAAVRATRGGLPALALHTVAGAGYAVPGVVFAAGLMFALLALERGLRSAGIDSVFLSTSIVAICLGLLARFVRIGIAAADSGFAALPASLGEAARSLGAGVIVRAWRVHLPLLRPALLGGLLMAFVECAKELPVSVMLRPFGFDTLAVKIYNATSEGLWQQAAAPSLLLLALGIWPALILQRAPIK